MKKLILLSIVLLSLLVAPLSEVFAQARLINYQGNILNQQDMPYEGPVQITFELYSAEFGGSQLWSEIQNVTLNKGYFNVYLGSVTPFPGNFNFNQELWLQVTVGKGSPYQRTMLSMVPYSGYSDRSAVAGFAEDIADGSVTLAKLAEEVITMGGDLTGFLPNPRLRPGAILENIPDGSITQDKLNPNVTTRPSGPASGDLTGFYPDPLIAAGAVKTDRLADGAVTNVKIADFTIQYNKLQNAIGPIGTILGWDGTKWIETNVPDWEKGRILAVVNGDGTYVNNVTNSEGFLTTTVGIADNGVTTAKIADDAVTYAKLQNAMGPVGTILGWNGTAWIETDVPTWEADAVIGNEVLNATPNRGLVRAGAGTAASPYTLGVAESGIVTSMIADDAVTLDKLVNGTMNGQITWWNAVTNSWNFSGGMAPVDNQVIRWVDNGVTRQPVWSSDDAIIGNELTDVVVGGGLERLGAGTTASPYLVGVAESGIVTSMIANDAVTYDKLQNAAGPIGTILGWNGGHWIETDVATWEKGRVAAVTAGAGTTVVNTTDAEGFISAAVGIADGGVTNNMLADGAVSLSKLAPGTQIGQIMWWDQAANQWRFSTGAAPTQDQVIKWIDAGGTLTPQWAPDDMTIPFEKTITEQVQTLFSLTNNGNSDVMSLTTTGTGDGLNITLPNDLNGGGNALNLNGGGLNQPTLLVNRTSEFGLSSGAAAINATVNTLDARSYGLLVNTTINDDGNNDYNVDGIRGTLTVNNGVAGALYTGIWGDVVSTDGTAIGVWGDADGMNANVNIGTIGDAENGSVNVGLFGGVNANPIAFSNALPAGFSAGLIALNQQGAADDFGIWAETSVNGIAVNAVAANGSALVANNNSATNATAWVNNNGNGPAFWATGINPATNGWSQTNSVSATINTAGGRAMYVEGGAANNENGGLPYFSDLMNNDDAALIVGNPNAISMGGAAPWATAIKTYGDIWANSAVGADRIIGLNQIVVGDLFGAHIIIDAPAAIGDPLVINGDVDIIGDLDVEDINADDIVANSITVALGTFDNIQVNMNANVDGNTTLGGTLAVAGASTLNGATTINNTLNVTGLTTLANLNAVNGAFSGTLGVTGATTLGSTLAVAGNTTVGGTLGVTGHTSLSTLATSGLATLNSAAITNNATVGGTLGVTGATTLGSTLTVAGATQINNNLGVTGNATIGGTLNAGASTLASLVVTGTSNLQGAATLGNTLTVAGATTLNGATQINNTLGVTGATTLASTLAVAGNTTVGGTLGVTGATTLNNTLTVAGASTLNGATQVNNTLGVTGATTLGNTLTVAGATQVNNTLGVTGATTLGNTLTVAGTTTLNGALVSNNTATFNNPITLNAGAEVSTNGTPGLAGDLFISRGVGLSPEWTTSIPYLEVTNLDVLQDANIGDELYVGGAFEVDGISDFNNDVFINAADLTVGGDVFADNLTVNFDGFFGNDLEVDNDLFVNNDATVTGELEVTGATTLNSTLDVTGATTIGGATQINNTLGVTGITTLGNNLIVQGTTDLQDDIFNSTGVVSILDDAQVTGNLVVTGGPGQGMITGITLQIQQNATINQNLTVNQNATVAQNLTVGGHTSINTLDVTGAIVNPAGLPNDKVFINDDLLVSGDATINGSLVILGDLTATNITATNNLSAGNDLSVTNNATVGGTLGVTGATTLANTLTVAGATTLNGATQINNTLGVTGNTSLSTLSTSGLATLNSLAVTNNATVGGTLNVTGLTTLADVNAANGTFSGTLGVTGNTTLSTLTTTGLATLNSASVVNNASIGGTLNVTGLTTLADVNAANGTFSGTLGVTGNTTLSTVTTSGLATLNSLAVTNNATVGGDLGVTGTSNLGVLNAGNTSVTGTITATNNIQSTTGSITAFNGLTTQNGDVVATTGNLVATAGDVNALAGDVNAINGNFTGNVGAVNGNFSGVITQTLAGSNNTYAGNLIQNGVSTFSANVTLTPAAGLSVGGNAIFSQNVIHQPYDATDDLNWSEANIGQRVSFIYFDAVVLIGPHVVTNLPEGSAGAVLYVFNDSGTNLTMNTSYGAVVIGNGQLAQFINITGGAGNWKLSSLN